MSSSPITIFDRAGVERLTGTQQPAGGGSQPGAVIVRAFPFAFNDAGIEDGIAVYTPTVGDLLLDAWFEVDTAWDGTTPLADFGTFTGSAMGLLASQFAGAYSLGGADGLVDSLLLAGNPSGGLVASEQTQQTPTFYRPAVKFTTVDPLLIVVSQDGTKGGVPTGGAAGAGVFYTVTTTPA